MKHCIILIALLGGMFANASARSAEELSHGGHHHHSSSHHSSGHTAFHIRSAHRYHPSYYSHVHTHVFAGSCEKRYDRCVRRHPSHPYRCRACR